MDLTEKQYPYPVLTPTGDDYLNCTFNVTGESVTDSKNVKIMLKTTLQCAGLRELIEAHKAKIILHIECSQSAYRKAHEIFIDRDDMEIVIPCEALSGKVSLCPFIVAQCEIPNYHSAEFNPIYLDLNFPIQCGAVLAEGTQMTLFVNTATTDIDYKPDIFSIIPNSNSQEEIKNAVLVDTAGPKIKISIPESIYGIYKAMLQSGTHNEFLWSVLILPAIVEGLTQMSQAIGGNGNDCGEFEEYAWCQVLKNRLKHLNPKAALNLGEYLENESLFLVAQNLIKNPIKDVFEKMHEITLGEEEEK